MVLSLGDGIRRHGSKFLDLLRPLPRTLIPRNSTAPSMSFFHAVPVVYHGPLNCGMCGAIHELGPRNQLKPIGYIHRLPGYIDLHRFCSML